MNSSVRRLVVGASFFGATCVVAVVGYVLAGWQFLDALYMVVITVFGVGYGETRPLDNPALKLFTMAVIISGCSSGIYFVGGFVQMLAEGEINRALGNRRMSKGIENLIGHAVICGYGRVGQMLAHDLAEVHYPFVVIDASEKRVAEAQTAGYLAVLGSASEEATLQAAGIERARVMAVVLPDDTANVFVTLTARDMNATIEIIARAESPLTERKLMRSGANRVVMPALIGATKIGHIIVRPSAEDLLMETKGMEALSEELMRIGLELNEIELAENSPLVGRTVGEVEVGGTGGYVIVAIRRKDGSLRRAPEPDVVLEAGDQFVILGHQHSAPELNARANRTTIMYRGATA
jgi:voltage-gated potassium channel